MLKDFKNYLYVGKEWAKRMYIYPQSQITPGAQFDYDAYWQVKRKGNMGSLGSWQKKRLELTARIIGRSKGRSVNDIGSGAGEILKALKERLGLAKAVAYDSSDYALEFAREFGLEAMKFDASKPEEYSKLEEADFMLMFELLEHLPGPEKLLEEVYKKSKMGVLFSFPNTGFFIHRFRLFFFGKFPLQWAKHPGEHLRFWTLTDLKWWLKAQGYKNYKIHYYQGLPILKDFWPSLFCAGFLVELSKEAFEARI